MSISDRLKDRIRKIARSSMALPRLMTRKPRERTFRTGVLLGDHGERLAVVIKDVSDAGARVEFINKMELPRTVVLIDPTMKIHRRATVAWQREGAAGLRF